SVSFGGATWLANGTDVFLVKLDGSTGAHVWSRRCTGTYTNVRQGNGVAMDGAGNVVIAGYFYGSVNCGTDTPTLTGAGYSDVLVAKFDGTGVPIWMKSYGNVGSTDVGTGVATDPVGGEVVLSGSFDGRLTIDTQAFSSIGLSDTLLVRMVP